MQISESHCGPAVIQMLLSHLGVEVTQEAVAEAGGATSLIELNGMRVDQLALAVQRLAPRVQFWFKDHTTINELVHIVNEYRTPVGVEWQGLFEDDDDEDDEDEEDDDEDGEVETDESGLAEDAETDDEDYGHYSVVVRAYRRRRQLIIADPYKDYISQARIIGFDEFDARWYDFNEFPDPLGGVGTIVKDDHMLFVITGKTAQFPRRMGFRRLQDG